MEISQIDDFKRFSSEKFLRNVVRETGRSLMCLLCFEPGQTFPLHKHPDSDEYLYVMEGSGEVVVDSETVQVQAGAVLLRPAGAWHNIKNNGNDRLVILSFQAPMPRIEARVMAD
ncbi:MAG: cupin domain-containing protein [Chloroflexi bacterium]|nr:cupin domain-containing protein [Chloroflexota bacterium]